MAFFPEIEDIVVQSDVMGIDFTFKNGQHILNADGRIDECDSLEALKNIILKVVKTQAGAYEVYTRDEKESFGVSLYDKLGTKDRAYWLSEIKREITQQLERYKFIDNVKDFGISIEKRNVIIEFTVVTSEGLEIKIDIRGL